MKTVFFYSFKGGVGRTQLLLNIAKYLTEERNKKIAIVDFDLYAPGLSYLAKFDQDKEGKSYLINYLINLFEEEESSLYYENINDNLTLIPATNPKNMTLYHDTLNKLSQYSYSVKKSAEDRTFNIITLADKVAEYLSREISKINDNNFDYIFFDGRTGITEVSDILFSKEIDLKIMISSYNKQNINGMQSILNMMSEYLGGEKHKILRILSPKPVNNKECYKDILFKADLGESRDIRLRNMFDWIDTAEVPYEEEIVHNDFEVWEELKKDNNYYKSVVSIAESIDSALDNNSRISKILKNGQILSDTENSIKRL